MIYKEVFSNMYNNFGFGSTESRSGPGSTLEETKVLREDIKAFISSKGIKSIVDIPCGDFHWMKEISDIFESYIGGDVVEKAITENNEKYSTDKIKFINFDLLNDTIPGCDLLIVRDIIGHFPLEDGKKIVENIIRSNCKYVMSTTWAKKVGDTWSRCDQGSIHRENEGVDYGRFYPVNLMASPFNFPDPEIYLEEDVRVDGFEVGNRKALVLWNLDDVRSHLSTLEVKLVEPQKQAEPFNLDLTIVTGLWNISRVGRDFDHYIEHFNNLLDIDANLFIYIPVEYEYLVWKKRSTKNTFVKVYELSDVKQIYAPFWDKTQNIRTNPAWYNQTGEGGWLTNSPQASNEWYNPIVQSKMFMLNDATLWNPFSTNNFIWLDAGITNTVYEKYFTDNKVLDKIIKYIDPFLFLSYPYETHTEIHGFNFDKISDYAGSKVEYVCRGGLFGGTKQAINEANGMYYSLLDRSLSEGLMGTEESIFAIMSYIKPEMFRRYSLDGNGLIVKFIQALDENKVELEEVPESRVKYIESNKTSDDFKTSLYMLTFNFPEQVEHTIKTYLKHSKWLTKTRNILIDNSTNDEARSTNKLICDKYNFEHIITGKNGGICGGRQLAAEHFQESDSDYYIFLEDDMQLHEEGSEYCRNGFRHYVPNLYDAIHKIMNKSNLDYLKLSFTEVYMDNHIQVSWYNVPQHIRTEFWPDYDRLPTTGLDPNCPRTDFKKIESIDGVSYITGDVYYANWPMIVGKEGNRKMFLETTWAYPYEQTWMSYIYQETKKGNIKPGVLLASPINHNRFMHYKAEDRREN